jgi:hypothetical protein
MKYRLQISNHTSVTVFGFTLLNPGTGELSVSFFIRCLEITEIIEHFVRYFSQYLISKVGSGVAEWSVGDGELVLQWVLQWSLFYSGTVWTQFGMSGRRQYTFQQHMNCLQLAGMR